MGTIKPKPNGAYGIFKSQDKHFVGWVNATNKTVMIGKAPQLVNYESAELLLRNTKGCYCKKAPTAWTIKHCKPQQPKEAKVEPMFQKVIKAEKRLNEINSAVIPTDSYKYKYAQFICKVGCVASCVPIELAAQPLYAGGTPAKVVGCTQFVYADKMLKKAGVNIPMAPVTNANGEVRQVPISPIMGGQIWTNLNSHPTMGLEEVAMSIAALEDSIVKAGYIIIGAVEDMLLYIDPRYRLFSDKYIKHQKRLQANALQTSIGPAIIEGITQFVDTPKDAAQICDGGAFAMKSAILPHIPVELHPLMVKETIDDTAGMSARMLPMDTTKDDELGKINIKMMSDERYKADYKYATGNEWKAGDPILFIPEVSVKEYKGKGIRLKVYSFLTGAYTHINTFTQERVSTGEISSTNYTEEGALSFSNTALGNTLRTNKNLESEAAAKGYFTKLSDNEVKEVMSDDEAMSSAHIAGIRTIATSSREWLQAHLPMHNIAGEMLPFFSKKITTGVSVKEIVLTLRGLPRLREMDKGIIMVLPTYISRPLSMMGNEPGSLKSYIRVFDDHYAFNLQLWVKDNRGIGIKRTPVVNGKLWINYDEIEWVNHMDGIEMCKELAYLLNGDFDGDSFKLTMDNPAKHVNIYATYRAHIEMINAMTDSISSIALDSSDMPTYDGKPDAATEIKEICDRVVAVYPKSQAVDVVRSLYAESMPGPSTNAGADIIQQYRSTIYAHKDAYIFVGALQTLACEGPVRFIKHPERTVIFHGPTLRGEAYNLINSCLDTRLIKDRVSIKEDERIIRKGVKMGYIRVHSSLVVDDTSVDVMYDKIRRDELAVVEEKAANLEAIGRYQADGPTRTLNSKEQLIYLKRYEHIDLTQVNPLYHDAINAIKVKVAEWTIDRDTNFDNKIKIAMSNLVRADSDKSVHRGDYSRLVFYSIFKDGKINWETNHEAGLLAYSYFNDTKVKNKIVVAEARAKRSILPAYLVLNVLYQDAMGFNTPNVLMDNFTLSELKCARYLVG